MTEHKPEAHPLRSRAVGHIDLPDQDAYIDVDHVFLAEGKAGVRGDPGQVGLLAADDKNGVSLLMSPGKALRLADRLTRAANLALESQEGPPDLERDIARITQAAGVPPKQDEGS